MNDGDDHMEGPGIGPWLAIVLITWVLALIGVLIYIGMR